MRTVIEIGSGVAFIGLLIIGPGPEVVMACRSFVELYDVAVFTVRPLRGRYPFIAISVGILCRDATKKIEDRYPA